MSILENHQEWVYGINAGDRFSDKKVQLLIMIKFFHLCIRRSSTGQEKCEERGGCHPVPTRDFRVDSRLVRWPLRSKSHHCIARALRIAPNLGGAAQTELTKGFSDLTIVGTDSSKTKYAQYCPEIRSSSAPGQMHISAKTVIRPLLCFILMCPNILLLLFSNGPTPFEG